MCSQCVDYCAAEIDIPSYCREHTLSIYGILWHPTVTEVQNTVSLLSIDVHTCAHCAYAASLPSLAPWTLPPGPPY